jgi:hypothetical protein
MALPSLMNTFHHRNHPHSDQAHVETHKYTTEKREERRERRQNASKEGRRDKRGEERREGRMDTDIQVIRVDENEDRSSSGWMIT